MNVLLMRIWMFVFGFIVVVYWFNCMLIYVSR
jgi:Cyclic nucleotide-binding domain